MKVKIESVYLIPKQDVVNDEMVKIVSEGIEEEKEYKGKKEKRITLDVELISGETKKLTLNKTSKKNLIKVLGEETNDWINKMVRVNIVPTNIGGEIKDVIYLTVSEE